MFLMIREFVSDVSTPLFGNSVQNVTWNFDNGVLTSINGGSGIELLREKWDKATGDKDRIAYITFGMNPSVKPNFLLNALIRGAVSVGIGDNRFLGGNNNASQAYETTLVNGSIKLDGEQIIRDGRIVI